MSLICNYRMYKNQMLNPDLEKCLDPDPDSVNLDHRKIRRILIEIAKINELITLYECKPLYLFTQGRGGERGS